jgi:putative transposase
VVIPDHAHWLVDLLNGPLDKTVERIKCVFTQKAGLSVWGYGFHDHAIRWDESLVNVARYIAANPLRAGLVTKLVDYPHWDSMWLK